MKIINKNDMNYMYEIADKRICNDQFYFEQESVR